MSSTLVLIALMVSLSVAVVFPELQYSKVNKSISNEYQFMVEKQRRGFITLGLIAIASFFIALQTLSVPIFVFHLIMMQFGIAADIVQKTRIGLKLLQLFVDLPDRPTKTDQ